MDAAISGTSVSDGRDKSPIIMSYAKYCEQPKVQCVETKSLSVRKMKEFYDILNASVSPM